MLNLHLFNQESLSGSFGDHSPWHLKFQGINFSLWMDVAASKFLVVHRPVLVLVCRKLRLIQPETSKSLIGCGCWEVNSNTANIKYSLGLGLVMSWRCSPAFQFGSRWPGKQRFELCWTPCLHTPLLSFRFMRPWLWTQPMNRCCSPSLQFRSGWPGKPRSELCKTPHLHTPLLIFASPAVAMDIWPSFHSPYDKP